MVSEASNPQDVVHRRAAGPCPIGTQSRSASRKAAPLATIHRPYERGGKFSASQSLEKTQNQKIHAGGFTPRTCRLVPLLRRTASPPPRPWPRRRGRRGGLPRAKAPEALKSLKAKLKSAPGTGRPPPALASAPLSALGRRGALRPPRSASAVTFSRAPGRGRRAYLRHRRRLLLRPGPSRLKAMGGGARAFANARSAVRGREREKDRSRVRRGLPRRRRFPIA
jgi:hypothetical protein